MVDYGHVEAEQKDMIASLEKELAKSLAMQKAARAELETTLKPMKFAAVDVILHARAKFIEEFKVGKYFEWDLDYEIGFWKEREAELAEVGEEGNAIGEPLTPRVESPRTTENVQVEAVFETATQD